LSAAIVYADDGWRALHVTHALVACFLASAFGARGVVTIRHATPRPWQWQVGAASIAAAAALFLLAPMLSRAQALREIAAHPAFDRTGPNEQVVAGGRHITGFLVVADEAERPRSIPALHVSDFIHLLRLGGLENELGPIKAFVERVPFALVLAPRIDVPRIDQKDRSNIFVAPPRILQEPDVWAWRLTMREPRSSGQGLLTLKEAVAVQSLP
jgi:hypothetical protein